MVRQVAGGEVSRNPLEDHRLVFEGADLPAGVYAVRAVGETFSDVRTLTLIR